MSKNRAPERLVLPAGARLQIVEGTLAVHNAGDVRLTGEHLFGEVASLEGDVELQGSLQARRLYAKSGNIVVDGDVEVELVEAPAGDVVLRGVAVVKRVVAGGSLRIEGRIEGHSVTGAEVVIEAEQCELRGIEGTRSVHLGAASYAVEVVLAPKVTCDAEAHGRINVLECHEAPEQSKLKGKFRLAEYAEFTGVDPLEFLEERGVRPLAEPAPKKKKKKPVPEPEPVVAEEEFEELQLPEPLAEDELDETPVVVEPAAREATREALKRPVKSTDKSTRVVPTPEAEDTSDLPDLEGTDPTDELLEDADPPEELAASAIEQIEDEDSLIEIVDEDSEIRQMPVVLGPEAHEALVASVDEMARTYTDRIPPQVQRLRALVDGKEYRVLRIELASLYNALISGHMRKKTRPHHQVYSGFNTIHGIVKES